MAIDQFAPEYEARLRIVVEAARTILAQVSELNADDLANGYGDLVAAAEAGQAIDGSTLVKEAAQGIRAVFGSFLAWVNTPIEEAGGLSPAVLLRKRF